MFYTGGGGWGESVRPWVSPLMHIIRVFLETRKQFCCHWSCSNRVCLSMQYTWERVSKEDRQLAADIATAYSSKISSNRGLVYRGHISGIVDKTLYQSQNKRFGA